MVQIRRLAVERGLPEADQLLAARNTLWSVARRADGRCDGLY
jgi:hypothetical protein